MFTRAGNGALLTRFSVFLTVLCILSQPFAANSAETVSPVSKERKSSDPERAKTKLILGVSWQPGFCETSPKTPECTGQTADRVDARLFSLNGLWTSRKVYCGVDGALKEQDKKKNWLDMPELSLDDSVKLELAKAMPGTASGFDRHQWVKHGTCSGYVADEYYGRALKLLAALNRSEVQSLFEDNLGATLDEAKVKAAFETAFGTGAGDKVKMRCRKDGDRRIITGLTIGLGDMGDGEDDLASLITAAGKTKFGCAEGVVDEAGLQ
ncbi:MAG: ribonuclease, family [Rhizobium sp.]|nr:ribonuclease, family [Rhizobium sp.]